MPPTTRTTGKRYPERLSYDREAAYAVLDQALVAHVGLATDEGPVVLPTLHVRDGDRLLLHGSAYGRFMTEAASGVEVCVTVTLFDGLILGRAASHHSGAYRSVMVFGRATGIEDHEERAELLGQIVEGIVPGRLSGARAARRPSTDEAAYTAVLALPIEEFSLKTRSGFARDEPKDDGVEAWAGTIPFNVTPGTPVPDALTGARFPAPDTSALRGIQHNG
ncbi:pyridoxamine 5'-phosphate oxidase family protein [Streptomyces sp. NPDC087300]|uniref:pyridoxamine 5'-phosphate oxidase family protein n=1 Tax=Streptomyces sp. NPDC087300 TaxID=3365780 RepID=UPI0037F9CC20